MKDLDGRQRRRYRKTSVRLLVAGTLAAAIASLAGSSPEEAGAAPTASTSAITVLVNLPGHTVGWLSARFLGLSFESGELNSRQFDKAGNLPAMLQNLGVGVLRFGGDSVDWANYHGASVRALAGLGRLVRTTNWHVIYSVNLGHFDAVAVSRDAKDVARALRDHLAAIACGNEPDQYSYKDVRAPGYAEDTYLKDVVACVKAVHRGASMADIAGPETASTHWLPIYATAAKGTISLLDQHFYPLSNCFGPGGTAAELISGTTADVEADIISIAAAAAHRAGVPLRISETNSAACGGIPGLSDAYVSALWAVDYLLIAAEHGAAGVNFHGFLNKNCSGYTPICRRWRNIYRAQPVYYGLLFTHLLGTGRLLQVSVHTANRITAYAIENANSTIRVLIENLTASPKKVALHVGHMSGIASVVNLTGPSLTAQSGVRIEGAAVPADGKFSAGAPYHVRCHSGRCMLDLAPYTAVILTLRNRRPGMTMSHWCCCRYRLSATTPGLGPPPRH